MSRPKKRVRALPKTFLPVEARQNQVIADPHREDWPEKAIIFANTKHVCEKLYQWLDADGHRVGLLTGDVPQRKRLKILEQFTDGSLDFWLPQM